MYEVCYLSSFFHTIFICFINGSTSISTLIPVHDPTCIFDRMMAEAHRVRRQRSRSLAGSLSRSADWTEELERRLRSREAEEGRHCDDEDDAFASSPPCCRPSEDLV